MLRIQKTPLALATAIAIASTLLIASCGGSDDKPATPPTTPTTPQADTSCQVLASDGSTVVVGSSQAGDLSLPRASVLATAKGSSPATRRPTWVVVQRLCQRGRPRGAREGRQRGGCRGGRPVRVRADRAAGPTHGLGRSSCSPRRPHARRAGLRWPGSRRSRAAAENHLRAISTTPPPPNPARAERLRQRPLRSAPSAAHA